jgi:hypothetical protein
MSLCIVLYEFQMVAAADIRYPIRVGTAPVKMDNHDGTCLSGDSLLDKSVVYL